MAMHRVATPETVRWGVFDADFPPLSTVASGDTVVLKCVSSGPEVTPPTGTFTLPLHKGGGARDSLLAYPRAESSSHFISLGMHEDLDTAMKTAPRQMIAFITSRTNLSRQQACQFCSLAIDFHVTFCSLAIDFHVTQTVNGEKGAHGLLKKGLLF